MWHWVSPHVRKSAASKATRASKTFQTNHQRPLQNDRTVRRQSRAVSLLFARLKYGPQALQARTWSSVGRIQAIVGITMRSKISIVAGMAPWRITTTTGTTAFIRVEVRAAPTQPRPATTTDTARTQ